jgi:hypothetical protein
MLDDPWPFRNGIRLGIEHAAGDGISTSTRSVVFWYGTPKPITRVTDSIDLGDSGDVRAASYHATGTQTSQQLVGFYEGDFDGDISSLAYDSAILPGSQPPIGGQDPMHESVPGTAFSHPVGSLITFDIRVGVRNDGVIVRRRLDQATYGQRADVLVDGHPAGSWFTPGANTSKRWADSDFYLPARLTNGRRRLNIGLRILPSRGAPSGAPTGWTDSRYQALTILAHAP